MELPDQRSRAFLQSLQEIEAKSADGVPNKAFERLADETLLDNDFERRTRNFGILLEKMRAEDAATMHREFVRMHREGRPYAEEYALFANRWGELDGQAALELYFEEGNPSMYDVANVLRGWGQKHPEDALKWMAENPDAPTTEIPFSGYVAILGGWSRTDSAAATEWMIRHGAELEPGSEEQARFLPHAANAILLQKMYDGGIEGVTDWLSSLPDNGVYDSAAANAWNQIASERMDRLDPALAARTWSNIGDKSWVGVQEFSRFYDLVANGNEGDGQPFYEALAENGWTETRLIDQFERWAESDPFGTSAWLAEKNPSTAIRRAAVQGMVNHLKDTDPDAAAAWQVELERN